VRALLLRFNGGVDTSGIRCFGYISRQSIRLVRTIGVYAVISLALLESKAYAVPRFHQITPDYAQLVTEFCDMRSSLTEGIMIGGLPPNKQRSFSILYSLKKWNRCCKNAQGSIRFRSKNYISIVALPEIREVKFFGDSLWKGTVTQMAPDPAGNCIPRIFFNGSYIPREICGLFPWRGGKAWEYYERPLHGGERLFGDLIGRGHSPQLFFVKSLITSELNDSKYNDRRCENCIGADPDSSPETYSICAFAVGGIFFIGGMVIFGRRYLGTGKSCHAGLMVTSGWIVEFIGVGILCLGILALT
jgi:hypothetical protein